MTIKDILNFGNYDAKKQIASLTDRQLDKAYKKLATFSEYARIESDKRYTEKMEDELENELNEKEENDEVQENEGETC